MIVRIALLIALIGTTGVALDDAPGVPALPFTEDVRADTCDGWPPPVGKVLDECPHGPVP